MKILLTKAAEPGARALLRGRGALRPGRGSLELRLRRPAEAGDLAPRLENLPGVREVRLRDGEACPLACARGKKTFAKPLDFSAGPVLIAGPCAVESEERYLAAAAALKAAGAQALRAAIFKPRSSPYAFQGLGWDGLKIISKAARLTGLPLVTEATDPRQVARLAGACAVLQIGARNMQNYELLKEAAPSGRAVLLKRAAGASLREWLLSAEYLLRHGARRLVLCERGDYPRLPGKQALDLRLLAAARKATGLPVIADPSHAARDSRLVPGLARRALAAGADGLLVEASPDPLAARVDGRQTVTVETFRGIAALARCRKNS